MGEALLEIAEECNCKIKQDILKEIQDFWGERIETITSHISKISSMGELYLSFIRYSIVLLQ